MTMPLENIGFYTLSDDRCRNASARSPVWRAEILLSDRCNFRCPYCRGLREDLRGDAVEDEIMATIDLLGSQGLRNIRFSGGEPTLYPGLERLVQKARSVGARRVALSTNGSASRDLYEKLLAAGVDDFSISLDACCSATGRAMCGIKGAWEQVIENIQWISKRTYVTVGIVYTEDNLKEASKTVEFAHSLGVADIRIIPAAQYASSLSSTVDGKAWSHPILKYRLENMASGRAVRGLSEIDNRRCPLILDDLAIVGGHHFPCIIYLREKGRAIGRMSPNFRFEREEWYRNHDCYADPICRQNCLDVCVDYNNRWLELQDYSLPKIDPVYFEWVSWRIGGFFANEFGSTLRWDHITKRGLRDLLRKRAIGWCPGESLSLRPKPNHNAVMFNTASGTGWIHMRRHEFNEVFG